MRNIKVSVIIGTLIGLLAVLILALQILNKHVLEPIDLSEETDVISRPDNVDFGDSGKENDNEENDNEIIGSGVIGNITWEVYADGVYKLSGNGEFIGDSSVVKPYIGRITNIIVSDGITGIGDNAFSGLTKVRSVNLPYTLRRIGKSAFYHNKDLIAIEIPDSVETIGGAAFAYCEFLESIQLSESLIGISKDMLRGCIHLKSIVIPKRVEVIEYRAFYECKALESITFSEGSNLRSIDQEAFGVCESLLSVDLPLLTDLGTGIFMGCINLRSVILFDDMAVIPSNMFDGCRALRDVYWPIALTEIGDSAFLACESLTTVEFPNSLKKIGEHAFSGCSRLTSVTLNEGLLYIGNYAFTNCGLLEITLPSTLDFVGYQAFKQNKNLTKVTILPVKFKLDKDHPNNFEATLFQDCPVKFVFKYKELVIPTVMFNMTVRDNYQYLD